MVLKNITSAMQKKMYLNEFVLKINKFTTISYKPDGQTQITFINFLSV